MRIAHESSTKVLETPAILKGIFRFQRMSDGLHLSVHVGSKTQWNNDKPTLFFPLHEECLGIVKKVIKSRLKPLTEDIPYLGVRSLQDVLMVLDFRFETSRLDTG